MRPKIPWLGDVSLSNFRLTMFLRYQVNRFLSQTAALGFKFATSGTPRTISGFGNFESLKDYFAKTAIDYDTSNANNKYLIDHALASQAISTSRTCEESGDFSQNELPPTDSNFRMTEELFQASMRAESGSPDSFWSHRLYRGPVVNEIETRPTVHYCRSSGSTEKTLKSYFMDQKVIGFDIEWKADALKFHGPRANVSLIQIASEERIGLFHIALYPRGDNLVSPSMRKILEDPTVSKVGVAIKSDCTRVRKHLNIECQGLFELSHLFKLVKFSQSKDFNLIDKKLVSLAKQVQEHFHLPLFKGGDVRHSDWSRKLQLHQMVYAAADSYAAIQLYHTLELKRKALHPTPPRPQHAELNIPIQFIKEVTETEAVTQCSAFKDKISTAGYIKSNRCINSSSTLSPGSMVKQISGKPGAEKNIEVIESRRPDIEGSNSNLESKQVRPLSRDFDTRKIMVDAVRTKEESEYLMLDSTSPISEYTSKIEQQASQYPLTHSKSKVKESKRNSSSKSKKCSEPKAATNMSPIPRSNTLSIDAVASCL